MMALNFKCSHQISLRIPMVPHTSLLPLKIPHFVFNKCRHSCPKTRIRSPRMSSNFPIGKAFDTVSQSIRTIPFPALSLDESVLKASLSSSFKLFAVCAFVVWLQKRGSIPESTSTVFSQVSFYTFIPCFLLSKVASSLVQQELKTLLFLPFVAVIHVMTGAILGMIICKFVYPEPPSKISSRNKSFSSSSAASASLIASSVADAVGLPLNSTQSYSPPSRSEGDPYSSTYDAPVSNSYPRRVWQFLRKRWMSYRGRNSSRMMEGMVAPEGIGLVSAIDEMKRRVLISSCAFGNSMTLPIIYVSGVLSSRLTSSQLETAISYIALYMVGWSPTLWTSGLNFITQPKNGFHDSEKQFSLKSFFLSLSRIINPPLIGIMLGILIGATPLKNLFFSIPNQADPIIPLSEFSRIAPLILLSKILSAVFKPLMETISLIGSSTLSVQTIVLASSLSTVSLPSINLKKINLFGNGDEREKIFEQNFFSNDNMVSNKSLSDFSNLVGKSNGILNVTPISEMNQEIPLVLESNRDSDNELENDGNLSSVSLSNSKSLFVICLVRLCLMPIFGILIAMVLRTYNLIPSDPICSLVIMIQSAMPTAQNLVLLCQLQSSTQPIAGMLASLMLKQYAISMIPITFWLPIFLSIAN